ncbi:MAG: hypothetical protein ACK40O_10145 [Allosphingosinicella sp.]
MGASRRRAARAAPASTTACARRGIEPHLTQPTPRPSLAGRGIALASALALSACATAPAAEAAQPQPGFVAATEAAVPADPADVASVEAIVAALYDVISGPAGEKRDWDRMRSLFSAGGRLMPLGPQGLRVGGVEDYIRISGPLLEKDGFFEREIGRTVEHYGGIAHVFSAYEARNAADGPVILRGINSIQLARHGGRWWVVSVMWQPETPENPIPPRYLTAPGG